jgi:hypothetical protein
MTICRFFLPFSRSKNHQVRKDACICLATPADAVINEINLLKNRFLSKGHRGMAIEVDRPFKTVCMEFGEAIQNLILYSDRIKDLDRHLVQIEEENKKRLAEAVENGLIYFDKAKVIWDALARMAELRVESEQAVKMVAESKEALLGYLGPFEGYRIVYEYASDKGTRRTCQVFIEDAVVKFI